MLLTHSRGGEDAESFKFANAPSRVVGPRRTSADRVGGGHVKRKPRYALFAVTPRHVRYSSRMSGATNEEAATPMLGWNRAVPDREVLVAQHGKPNDDLTARGRLPAWAACLARDPSN